MAFVNQVRARGLNAPALAIEAGREFAQRSALQIHISSFSCNGASSLTLLRSSFAGHHQRCSTSSQGSLTRAAVSKQKKKVKDRKRSRPSEKKWEFDELMLVWDNIFQKACDSPQVASSLYNLSQEGFSQFGRGCLLMQEVVRTRPRGAASGFSFKSRRSASASPELPFYTTVQSKAEYVPKEFIIDPLKAPVSSDAHDSQVSDGVVRVVDQAKLFSVLGSTDRTRLRGLVSDLESEDPEDAGARDAGGEEPYDPANDELVIMLAVTVDEQQAVGADVLKAFPTVEDGVDSSSGGFWTLKLRDEIPD